MMEDGRGVYSLNHELTKYLLGALNTVQPRPITEDTF